MPEQYVHPRQPDYDSWPEGEIFARKRKLLDDIQLRHDTHQGITKWDYQYLYEKAENYWQLLHFASNERIMLETEIFARDMEIDDLKRQLKAADLDK